MSFEQRNADFCRAQTDVQMAYIEAEREVKQLKAENAKLHEYIERKKVLQDYARLFDDNAKLRELCAGLLTGYECGRGKLCEGCTWDGLGDPKTFPCLPRVKARELGIEVGE